MSRGKAPSLQPEDYFERGLQPKIIEALKDTPVVCLLGPRQCGKSTLAARLEPSRLFVSLDDAAYLKLAQEDPQGFLAELPDEVTIDEVQRAPGLTLAIKRSVDHDRRPGRYILTGSANLLQLPTLADSLAGRMETLQLHPLTESEKARSEGLFLKKWLAGEIQPKVVGSQAPKSSTLPVRLLLGGYPEACRRSLSRAQDWLRQYLQSIIERDIQDVAKVKDSADLASLMELLAERTATLLNISELAGTLKRSRATVENHLAILEKLFLVRRLPAWHQNATKRAVRTPKIHLCDSGLAAALTHLEADDWLTERPRFGHLLESFIVQQLIAQASWSHPQLRFWHYRDKDKNEVDCVITRGQKVWGVEVKLSQSVSLDDAKGLRRLAGYAKNSFQSGVVFYDGHDILTLGDPRFLAVPISMLWEL
ncbi:ATP-binding protein [Pelagicoccus sp. SDUM812002]|uniref:ATP-binding protein n=1 Tax=Pelagicoccus sp. SDUM812002 TaxID=3041266 RepID=UPI00280EB3C8|nr:ATP-binding protein [Pelagicoccus sp. SDUM812002]MDQ8187682.1 ATP-binding protein [Pelagicoccus sp. SDUM812002]